MTCVVYAVDCGNIIAYIFAVFFSEQVAWCRAWDTNGEVQTQTGTTPWNLRGMAYNGFGEYTW